MSLTIIRPAIPYRPARFKATEEWEQKLELEKGWSKKYFDRNFSFSKKATGLGLVGYLNFNVKLKNFRTTNQYYVIIRTESTETFIDFDFKIMIEYSTGGKFASNLQFHSFNNEIKSDPFYFHDLRSHRDIKANVEINVTYKVTFELELKKPEMPSMKPNLLRKLYSDGEFSDVKIHCDGKVFNCHKLILSGQSEVFKQMLDVENKFVEATSGEIKITDTQPKITATAMENILFFIYHENLDEAKITGDLLVAANKYDVSDLVNYCVKFLGDNLSEKNVAGVMTSAFLTDQEELFESAYKFLFKLRIDNQIVETEAWKKLQEEKPVLALKMINKAVFKL